MVRNIISALLLIISVALGFKHGLDTLNYKNHPESVKMIEILGINEAFIPAVGLFSIIAALFLLIRKPTF